jgi:hypothetical protein
MILLDAPQFGKPRWIYNFEHPGVMVLPCYVVGVTLSGVIQQLLEEVPQ